MEINVQKPSGIINVDAKQVINYIYDQVIMIPGVKRLEKKDFTSRIKHLFHMHNDVINLVALGNGVIGVEIHVLLSNGVNFKAIAHQIQERVSFSVEQKFGIKVNFVDVIIEGTE